MRGRLERFKPGLGADPELHAQHLSRYEFASRYTFGKRVIDVACGTGYGAALLVERGAASVVGIDISGEAIALAKREHASRGVSFVEGDVSVVAKCGPADLVISFETIEHIANPDSLIVPAREVLGSEGTFIVSTPVRHGGSLSDRPANPFHVREWNEEEFDALLARHFPARNYFHQYACRKYPWPLSRTINGAIVAWFFAGASAELPAYPVVAHAPRLPGALVERGYMVAVCSRKAV